MVAADRVGKMPPLCQSSPWGFYFVQIGTRWVGLLRSFHLLNFWSSRCSSQLINWWYFSSAVILVPDSYTRWELLPAIPCQNPDQTHFSRLLYTMSTHKALPCIALTLIFMFFINKREFFSFVGIKMQFVYINVYLILLCIPLSHDIWHCNCPFCNHPDKQKRIMTLSSLGRRLK